MSGVLDSIATIKNNVLALYLFIYLFIICMILVRHGTRQQTDSKAGLLQGYNMKVLLFVGLTTCSC